MNTALLILIGYLLLTFGIAIFFSRQDSIEEYFLNKKKTGLWMMTFSNVASLVGAGAVVSVVAEGYNSGISYGIILPLGFIFGAILLAIFGYKIKEFSAKHDIYTIVEFFEKRFDRKNKILVGFLQIILLLFWIGIQAVAFASLASVLIGFDYIFALILASVITILYTAIGGLKVDIISDFIQFWIIFIMFIVIFVIGLGNVGGFENLFSSLPQGHLDVFSFGGIGFFISATLFSGFLFIAGTQNWQRIISAKNKEVARKSFLLSIPFLIIISIFTLFMGLFSSVLLEGINKNTAIFSLMQNILPTALYGIGLASILAVIMSSIDSLLIGGSTIISREIFKKRYVGDKEKLLFARLLTGIFGVVGFLVALIFPDIVNLSILQGTMALIFPAAIIAGLYSKRVSSNASFYSILIPFVLLVILFPILEKQTLMVTTPFSILIVIFYDKIFKRK
jgi:Na+/proline symporter